MHADRNVRRNGTWRLDDEVISGFTGRIRYACDQSTDNEAAAFDALLRFAALAGAGSHTTYGFGVISPEPTWQPPATRPRPVMTATTRRQALIALALAVHPLDGQGKVTGEPSRGGGW